MKRTAQITRNTYETNIQVFVDLDAKAAANINTGIGFLDHMIEQIARHAQIELNVTCDGDTHIDDHHSTEDIGITIGQALAQAVGDKKGIYRYGHAYRFPNRENWYFRYRTGAGIFPGLCQSRHGNYSYG